MSTLNFDDDEQDSLMSINNYNGGTSRSAVGTGTIGEQSSGNDPNLLFDNINSTEANEFRVHYMNHNTNNNRVNHRTKSNGSKDTVPKTTFQQQGPQGLQDTSSLLPPLISSYAPTSLDYLDLNDDNLVLAFQDIAKTINLELDYNLTSHLLKLIRLGIPPDNIYMFLKDSHRYSRLNRESKYFNKR